MQEIYERHNEGKLLYQLIPNSWTKVLAEVFTKGAEKYERHNWKKGGPWSDCKGSMDRHWEAWVTGETYDVETGCHHLAHLAWNALCLMWWQLLGVGQDDIREEKMDVVAPVVKSHYIPYQYKFDIEPGAYNYVGGND